MPAQGRKTYMVKPVLDLKPLIPKVNMKTCSAMSSLI